jgi:hypothetical protein
MRKSNHIVKSTQTWQRLLREALLACDPFELKSRLHDAKHAIMDCIEDSLRTASQSERRVLGTALQLVSTMQRPEATPHRHEFPTR